MSKRKRFSLFWFSCLSLILAIAIVPPGSANGVALQVTHGQSQTQFTSAVQYGGPDKPLVDQKGNPVRLKSEHSILIDRVVCDPNRDDFLQFWDYGGRTWCFANRGYTTTAGMVSVDYWSSGNNNGAFYYDNGIQCVQVSFGKWQAGRLGNEDICLVEIY